MPVEEYCLGLEALGHCAASSSPLISIGEALAVAVLLVAFYRFSGALANLRWCARGLSPRVVLGTIALGVVLVLIAGALRLFGPPWARMSVVGYPLFWELFGAFVLTLAGTALAFAAFTRARLTPRNAESFLAANQTIIANGEEKALRDLGYEIAPSVETVTRQCRAHRDRESREGHIEAEPFTRTCYSLLDTWSDARFCNVLVCWCPETVMAIVKELTEHALHGDGSALGSELVNQAFADERSMLYREARQSGLRRQRVFLKALFAEWVLLDSAVRPLASWNVFSDPAISQRKIKRWGEAVDSSLSAFIENGKHGVAVFRVRQGLETLNHLCASVLADRARHATPWGGVHDRIYEIAGAFRTVIKRIRTSNLPAPSETTVENYDPLQDETLHGAIAEELFHFIGLVCSSDDHEFLDVISMGPWKELFEEGELTSNLRALQVRVAYHIMLKIDDNLDPQRRFPPPITRMLLVRYPLSAADEHPRSAMAKELDAYFVTALKTQFPLMWKANRAFAQSLLPDNTDYDERRALIRVRHPRRDTQTIPLDKPATPEGRG